MLQSGSKLPHSKAPCGRKNYAALGSAGRGSSPRNSQIGIRITCSTKSCPKRRQFIM
jgi:hypothetical protein